MTKPWPYNNHTPCLPLTEYYIEQTIIYSSLKYNKLTFQCFTCNLKYVYWNKVNKLEPNSLLLHQPVPQSGTLLWRRCGLLGHLQMQCVITNCPVFPPCYIYHLWPYVSHYFAKVIWPYYPCWLYSHQVLYIGKREGRLKGQGTFIGRYSTAGGQWYCSLNGMCYSEHYLEDTLQQVESGIVAWMGCVTVNIIWKILNSRWTVVLQLE
jgi:hypothetical protein